MNKKIFSIICLGALIIIPTIALAAFDAGANPTFNVNAGNQWLIGIITGIFNLLWILFIALAIIMFIWAAFLFLKAQGDPTETTTARKALLWGIIGVMVAVVAFAMPFMIHYLVFSSPAPPPGGGGGCTNNSECVSNICSNGKCLQGRGNSCSSDSECVSNFCNNGVCN